jgi:crotonobetainyl-CoA:carnitine CoA-transferase CaiB-like acyl-CoA transferase
VLDQARHRLCVDVGLRPSGRKHHYTTFGPVAQAVSGLTYLSGLPDKPPAIGWGWSPWTIPAACWRGCALTGLYHRNMTGQGQHIDLIADGIERSAQRSGTAGLYR